MWMVWLCPSAATACRFQFACERAIAPAPGSVVPANAPFFVAGSLETFGPNADGGLMVPALSLGSVSLFEAGELIPGEALTLRGTDCGGADAGSTVRIGAEQPFPTSPGRLRFTEVARNEPRNPCDEAWPETVSYAVTLEPAPFVEPWLPLTRFQVLSMPREPGADFRQFPFGQTQLTSERELTIGTVTRVCSNESVLMSVLLEVAGRPPVEAAVKLEPRCVARGCSMTGAPPLVLGLALWRRRRRATPSATRAAQPCRP